MDWEQGSDSLRESSGDSDVRVNAGWRRRVTRVRLGGEGGAALRESGLPPESLLIEIPETAVRQLAEPIEYTLTEITASGARLSIDDFGTGYASLPMLQKLRASAVCIDRSLIAGIPHDNEHTALARTLISLARGLGLEVVAKGVENNAQREFLTDAGCRICQGDLFAPAGPAAEIDPFLRGRRAAALAA